MPEKEETLTLSEEATKAEAAGAKGADAVRARRKKGFLDPEAPLSSDPEDEKLHPASKEKPEHRNRPLDRVVVNEKDGLDKPNEAYAENQYRAGPHAWKPEEWYAEDKPQAELVELSAQEKKLAEERMGKELAEAEKTVKPSEALGEEKPQPNDGRTAPAGAPLESEDAKKKIVGKDGFPPAAVIVDAGAEAEKDAEERAKAKAETLSVPSAAERTGRHIPKEQ